MSKHSITPVTAIVGAALVGSLSASDLAQAATDPFLITPLESGYVHLAGAEGQCGEGKCGEGTCGKEDGEGKCGEGKCGGTT
ncbi:MAG: low-complexity protein [Chromatiaceae bacterium]|nr:MAG: low-complexity protein [Chromatiaceae bacterium]